MFQEVTPFILDILQNGEWYRNGGYQSTILPQYGFFCRIKIFQCYYDKTWIYSWFNTI